MSEKLINIYTNSALRETLGKLSQLWVIQAGTKYSTPLQSLLSIWKAGPPFSLPTSGHKCLFLKLTNVMVIAGVSCFVGMLGLAHKFSIFCRQYCSINFSDVGVYWILMDLTTKLETRYFYQTTFLKWPCVKQVVPKIPDTTLNSLYIYIYISPDATPAANTRRLRGTPIRTQHCDSFIHHWFYFLPFPKDEAHNWPKRDTLRESESLPT